MSKHKVTAAPMGVGVRIKAARELRGWTQPDLARRIGVSKSAVNQWENGAVQNLKLGNLFAVADALGKDVRELVFGDSNTKVAEFKAEYNALSPQQLALLQLFDAVPTKLRNHLRAVLQALANTQTD
jgi:transcriptional regulator with XRE-family HTH domain